MRDQTVTLHFAKSQPTRPGATLERLARDLGNGAARAAVNFVVDQTLNRVIVNTRCRVSGRTGVEMEALTAASIAALTIYDMCKAVDRGMTIDGVGLVSKSGGDSGEWRRSEMDD